MTMDVMPPPLAEVVSEFQDMVGQDKLTLLLEFADELPPLPAQLTEAAMEPVPECQSPLFLHVDAADRDDVRLFFSAPAEAPTTRGFASILAAGLDHQRADDILGVPDDFYTDLGLAALISPLRLRGMSAMLARIKRHLRQPDDRSSAEQKLELALYCNASGSRFPMTLAGTPPTISSSPTSLVDDCVRGNDRPAVDVRLQDHRPAGDPHVILDNDRNRDGREVGMVHVVGEADDVRVTRDRDIVADRNDRHGNPRGNETRCRCDPRWSNTRYPTRWFRD